MRGGAVMRGHWVTSWLLALVLGASAFAAAQEDSPPVAASITDASVRALIEAAEAIEMEADPPAARAAWQAVWEAASALEGVPETAMAELANQLGSADFYAGGRETALGWFQQAADVFAAAGPDYLVPLEQSLGNAASILGTLGRLDEAEATQREVLEVRLQLYPEEHVQVARSYFELGSVLNARGQLDEAIELVERSLVIREAVLEDGHPFIAMTRVSLAAILTRAYRHEEAADLSREGAQSLEANLPPGHPFIAFAQSNYAGALNAWGRHEAAEPLLRRLLEVRRETLGDTNPQVADTLNNLAVSLFAQGRAAEARPLFLAARDIYRAASGAGSVEAARMQMNAADAAFALGDYAAARAEWEDTLAVFDAAGTVGLDRVRVLSELAALQAVTGDHDAAQRNMTEAGFLAANYLPFGHERRLMLAIDEAWTQSLAGGHRTHVPRIVNTSVYDLARGLDLADLDGARDAARSRQRAFRRALDIAYEAGEAGNVFQILQYVHATGLALAAEATALRARAEGVDGAELLRARQEGWRHLRRAEDAYIRLRSTPGAPDQAALTAARESYTAARSQLAALAAPGGAYRASFASLQDVSAALNPGEAIIAFAFTEGGGVVMRMDERGLVMDRLAISESDALAAITRLRPALEAGAAGAVDTPFPADDAHALYAGIFTPAILDGLAPDTALFILADGPYRSLPFPVLLTAPQDGALTGAAALRSAPWLIRDHAVTTLPALSGLVERQGTGRARQPFLIGFGAPAFTGEPEAEGFTLASLVRSGGGDAARALSSLAPLPGAEAELTELAAVFGAARADIRLGMAATETAVKTADLTRASVLVFATHGLLPGELETVFEPALAFTPPPAPSAFDDGLLTASEIAGLQLDADWVILSACNTFAADGTARAPDRLAQAFLYAGARSLLVSHWTVRDDAAARLSAGTARRAAQGSARAEAFRDAVLELIGDESVAGGAHPGVWGPFALIGG
ncbi:MAG: CHAT domain-containing protein [Glycocaulis sp.]